MDFVFNPSVFLSYRLNEDWTRSLLYLIGISLFLNLVLALLLLLYGYLSDPHNPYSYILTLGFLRFGLYNILLTLAMAFIAHFIILSKKMDEITKSIQVFCYAQTPVLIAYFSAPICFYLLHFSQEIGFNHGYSFFINPALVWPLLLLIGIILMVFIINEGFKIIYTIHSSRYLLPIFILIFTMTEICKGFPICNAIFFSLPYVIMHWLYFWKRGV